jgi:AcrR family transcriptional regulator
VCLRDILSGMTERGDGQLRRGRPGHDQETVVRRAVQVFNDQGYDATSMGDLARALGLTKSAIYHHVPSKAHLLRVALDEALDGLTAALVEAESTGDATMGSAYERLRRAVRGSVRVLVEQQPSVTLLLRVRGNSDVEVEALRRRRDIDHRLAALVRAAAAEGTLRADIDPDLASRLVFGMVNSLVEWYRADGPLGADELAEALTAVAFEGLARHG